MVLSYMPFILIQFTRICSELCSSVVLAATSAFVTASS